MKIATNGGDMAMAKGLFGDYQWLAKVGAGLGAALPAAEVFGLDVGYVQMLSSGNVGMFIALLMVVFGFGIAYDGLKKLM